jgi:quercetin 2,3-dioxygenase
MKSVIKSNSRGLTKIDWLTSFHSFSFGNYFNNSRISFGSLRVINDDVIEPGGGFPTHPHKNMEIITIVLEGELSHADSTGKTEIIKYGEIQKMSAGSGIFHSEFNASHQNRVHLLQIWIFPDKLNIEPSYEKIDFTPDQIKNRLLHAAGNKPDSPVFIHQDAELLISHFDEGQTTSYTVKEGRQVHIHIIDGKVEIDDLNLTGSDAFETDDEGEITLKFAEQTRFLIFDLAKES